MKHKHPRWKCEDCGRLVTELSYCSSCWKMICSNCHDPYVGTCRNCAQQLFKGVKRDFSKATNHTLKENYMSTLSQHRRNIVARCKECYTLLIITPDRTKCCPRCGFVLGKGYSWIGRENPRDESVHVYEHHGEAYGY